MYFSYLIVHARHVHVPVLRTKAFGQEPQVRGKWATRCGVQQAPLHHTIATSQAPSLSPILLFLYKLQDRERAFFLCNKAFARALLALVSVNTPWATASGVTVSASPHRVKTLLWFRVVVYFIHMPALHVVVLRSRSTSMSSDFWSTSPSLPTTFPALFFPSNFQRRRACSSHRLGGKSVVELVALTPLFCLHPTTQDVQTLHSHNFPHSHIRQRKLVPKQGRLFLPPRPPSLRLFPFTNDACGLAAAPGPSQTHVFVPV